MKRYQDLTDIQKQNFEAACEEVHTNSRLASVILEGLSEDDENFSQKVRERVAEELGIEL